MIRWLALLSLIVITTCCTTRPTDFPAPHSPPAAIMTFDGDVDFIPLERSYIQEALDNLDQQTNGFIRVSVHYDLNFLDDTSLAQSNGQDLLVKIDTEARPVQVFNAEHCCLLGLTTVQPRSPDNRTVYLVHDQLYKTGTDKGSIHDVWVSVVMHEVLHALGLQHVDDHKAVMAPSLYGGPVVELDRNDYLELHRVYGASTGRLSNGRYY